MPKCGTYFRTRWGADGEIAGIVNLHRVDPDDVISAVSQETCYAQSTENVSVIISDLQPWWKKIIKIHRVERLFLLSPFRNVELFSGLWDSRFSRASENLRWKNSKWFLSSKRCPSSGCVCLPSRFFPSSKSFKAQSWPTVCALFHQFCVRKTSPLVWFMRCKHVICT